MCAEYQSSKGEGTVPKGISEKVKNEWGSRRVGWNFFFWVKLSGEGGESFQVKENN